MAPYHTNPLYFRCSPVVESQSVGGVAVNFNSYPASNSDPACSSVGPFSDSDSASASAVKGKRRWGSRGKDSTKKANERSRRKAKAALVQASRAIAIELHAKAQEARLQAQESLAVADRAQKSRGEVVAQLNETEARLRESERARTVAEGDARKFAAR